MISTDLWRRLREWLIGKCDIDVADQVAPSWAIDSLADTARQPVLPPQSAFCEPTQTTQVSSMTQQDLAALATENQRLKAQLDQHEKAARIAAQQATHASSVQYAEQLVAGGMKPMHVPALVAALDWAQAGDTPLEFGEGDTRQPLSEGLKSIFKELADAEARTQK